MSLRVNSQKVVHETIDGETILLDLPSGNYYSIDGIGALIWEYIDMTGEWEPISNIIVPGNKLETGKIMNSIEKFVNDLLTKELLISSSEVVPLSNTTALSQRLKLSIQDFISPVINEYTDMQDILSIDPIHEVNDNGWPEKKEWPEKST